MSKEIGQTVGIKWFIGILFGLLVLALVVVFLGQTSVSALSANPNSTTIQSISMPAQAGVLPAVSVERVAVADVAGSSMDVNVTTNNTYSQGAANAPYAPVASPFWAQLGMPRATLVSVVYNAVIQGIMTGSLTILGISGILAAMLVLAASDILNLAGVSTVLGCERQSSFKPQGGIYKRAQAPRCFRVPAEATT